MMVSGWWLSLPLVGNHHCLVGEYLLIVLYVLAISPILSNIGNTLSIMVNDDGYDMVNDGYIIITWLVVEPTPLINMSSSVGMMTFPIYGKVQNVPNDQAVFI